MSQHTFLHRAFAKFWVFFLVFFGVTCRIGEADKPGPAQAVSDSWSLGVCNPSGLLGKSVLLSEVDTDIVAVSETHLTAVSSSMMLASLRSRGAYKYVVTGFPMKPRTAASEAGQYAGVAVVSKQPSRALCSAWPQDMYETGRVQFVGSLMGQQWITGALIYGYPQSKFHTFAASKTAGLLAHAFDHMVHCAQGPRYMAGDWNFTQDQLAITEQLVAAGWQEVQTLEFQRTGQPPRCTCKGKSQKDHLWLSPELASAFQSLEVVDDLFPDHAVLKARFSNASAFLERFLWPMPQQIPWHAVPDMHAPMDFLQGQPSEMYAALWTGREQQAKEALQHTWDSHMQGRGQRTEPIHRKGWPAPLKQGRSNDPKPGFYGYDVQHARWMKQLRRLVNYRNWAQSHWHHTTLSTWTHGLFLWRSILEATGFGLSFADWWKGRVCVGLSDPGFVPCSPPGPDVAVALCECFECELRYLERRLLQAKQMARKHAHRQNPNLIFKDTRRTMPEPVSSLLVQHRTQVAEVDTEDVAVVIDPPCQFDDASPVFVAEVPVQVVHATDTKVYLESVAHVAIGDTVTQSKPVGALAEVFEAFHVQWKQRWCRHDQWPHSHWQNLIAFARAHMPQWNMPQLVIHPELLHAEVSNKKPTAATGLDGVSRKDLLAADTNLLRSLCSLYDRACTDGTWPIQTLTGKVASLAKVPSPQGTSDYRPITVFSLVYRCFSSLQARHQLTLANEWCHADIHGNRKHHQTAHLWKLVVDQIQCAYDQGDCVSGLTADIEKAFNCLPRYPVLAMALHVGTPFGLLQAWSGALANMVRRFKVRESFSSGFLTSTGLAEGCAMSCYGMLLLDDVMHRYVRAQCPAVRVLSFVDNWDFLTWDPTAAPRQLEVLLEFAALTDLTVDRRKTFGWSTCPQVRSQLRSLGIPVKHYAKDLGAHIAYSRQRTNQTLVQRLDALAPLWVQLKASKASYHSKLRALRCVAWPRGLFGVASAPLGKAVWLRHRRCAVHSLSFDKPGVNPMLLLGMVESQVDPEWLGTLLTVMEARLLCPLDFWAVDFSSVAFGTLDPPESSPTTVLLTRVQKLGIHVLRDGLWQDAIGSFHPGLLNYTELSMRLQWCWYRVVAASVQHRKDFGGLFYVDVAATRKCLLTLPPDHQALMRLSLAGGLFTQDAHVHWNQGQGTCKWCGLDDSLEHRYYQCPATKRLRDTVAPDVVRLRPSLPDALVLRSWAILPPTHLAWLQRLDSLAKTVPSCAVEFSPVGWNCVFTDGSCLWQSSPEFRVASWGAVLAQPFSDQWTFSSQGVLCSGVLPGLCQTAYRAELYALCVVLHHAAVGGFRVKLFNDCLGVINKFNLLTRGQVTLKVNKANSDLWQWAMASVERLGLEKIQLTKVAAHRQVASATSLKEAWLYWNNAAADRVARFANLDRGEDFWRFWQRHAREVVAAQTLHAQVWDLHLQVALLSVKEDSTATLDSEVVAAPRPTREFEKRFATTAWDGRLPPTFANEYGYGMANRIASWWKVRTTAGGSEIKWVSFVLLYVDYQLTWGCMGPLQSGRMWLDCFLRPYVDVTQYPFLKRVKWFKRSLKQLWSQSGQTIGMAICRCFSEVVQSHIASASIRWDPATLQLAEDWISTHCRSPVARGTKALQSLPPAKPRLGMQIVGEASNDAVLSTNRA